MVQGIDRSAHRITNDVSDNINQLTIISEKKSKIYGEKPTKHLYCTIITTYVLRPRHDGKNGHWWASIAPIWTEIIALSLIVSSRITSVISRVRRYFNTLQSFWMLFILRSVFRNPALRWLHFISYLLKVANPISQFVHLTLNLRKCISKILPPRIRHFESCKFNFYVLELIFWT